MALSEADREEEARHFKTRGSKSRHKVRSLKTGHDREGEMVARPGAGGLGWNKTAADNVHCAKETDFLSNKAFYNS